MGIPEEIRRVERPVNTVVVRSGRKGAKLYAVRERAGVKYGPNGEARPVNGRIIGHIFEGKFVRLIESVSKASPDCLSYGASAFIHSCSSDLQDDLTATFSLTDALKILAIASLRVLKPKVTAHRMSTEYGRTFISQYYPGLALTGNTISSFFQNLGMDGAKRKAFYEKRVARVLATHHVVIDGTLKQDTSEVNDLSAFSRKARTKGCKDISVIYAYDIERKEPVCSEVFPGNCIDAAAYRSFIRDNNLTKGIVLSDKGFPPSQIAEELKKRPDLHFLTPLKRNDTRIKAHEMYRFQGVLQNFGKSVFFKKVQLRGGRYLYSYRDTYLALQEEQSFGGRSKRHEDFDEESFNQKKDAFGTIVFESDQDLDPELVYRSYMDRWQIELVFQRYKSDECLDQTEVQKDSSVVGSEFINFISTVLTCRMLQKAMDANLLVKDSWADLLGDLSMAWRRVDAPAKPRSDDDGWVHTFPMLMNNLIALGLCEDAQKTDKAKTNVAVPGHRGRPLGSKNKSTLAREALAAKEPHKEKRHPGRPKGSKNKTTLEREARERSRQSKVAVSVTPPDDTPEGTPTGT